MAAKGSRLNPYTGNEYENMLIINTWQGGWVGSIGNLVYHSCSNLTYTGRCAKGYPVSNMLFSEMRQNGIWTGGWVSTYQNGTKYFDTGGTEYDITLGSQSNPCPLFIYDEMILNGLWEGGWVQDSNGQTYYMQVFNITLNSSSGSGCGCGSGAVSESYPAYGSGSDGSNTQQEPCRIFSGGCELGDVMFDEESVGKVYLSWTAGNTAEGGDMSVAELRIVFNATSGFTLKGNHVSCLWESAYTLSFCGNFIFEYNGENYIGSIISGSYVIPSNYHEG